MRSFVGCLLLGLLTISRTASAQSAQPVGTAEIRAKEEALFDAMRAKDRAALENLLADDYVLRGKPDIDRATWIRNAVELCWGDRMDIAGFSAAPVGDTVVASFELTFYVDPSTCQPATLRSLITDVWVRDAAGWRLRVRHSSAPPSGAGVASQFGAVPEPPPRWEINGELSFVATGGNTSTNTLGSSADALHRGGRTTTRASVAFVRTETDNVTQARSLLAKLRHGVRLKERLEGFGQLTFAQDRFAGIDARTSIEAGVAHTTTLPRSQTITTEAGLGYTIERRLDAADLDFAIATGSLRYAWTIRPGMDLTEDLNIVADLEQGRNWRGRNTAAFTVALTRLLSFRASHTAEYRNRPVERFGRTDTRLAAALVLSLRRR